MRGLRVRFVVPLNESARRKDGPVQLELFLVYLYTSMFKYQY